VNIAREFNGRYLNARVDEVRISRVARSSNWLWAVHRNIASNQAFVSYAAASNLLPNTAPVFEVASNRTAAAGGWAVITNRATDADQPAQTLTYTLEQGPTNATLAATNGVLTWRPAVVQAGTSHAVRVAVVDDGWPALGATQVYQVVVPAVGTSSVSALAMSNGVMLLQVAGDAGLDYLLDLSTNLFQWTPVAASNAAVPPFHFLAAPTNGARGAFYRLRLGP
jgi:hypothetical protein